jgi:hypothetical protein
MVLHLKMKNDDVLIKMRRRKEINFEKILELLILVELNNDMMRKSSVD